MRQKGISRHKPIILIIANYYLPGYKSGGGLRTIVNIVDRLSFRYDFWILTKDHDGKLDKEQYTSVKINEWNEIGKAKVFYLTKNNIRISKVRELILEVKPDAIYLNSFFATLTLFVLQLRKLKLIPNLNVILAPCGELSDGALLLKPTKKRIYLNVSKVIKLYKNVLWKPSTELEKNEIERLKPAKAQYFIAPDLPPKHIFEDYDQQKKPCKESGSVRMVFLSRIMRKKNLKWLLENLSVKEGNLLIDIFGPIEDQKYWDECLEIMKTLPSFIKVNYKGSIPHNEVLEILFQYHYFILPTIGENFGHIFLEALACGCPLIISDLTPWLNLDEKEIGWDLSLNDPQKWNETISNCIFLSNSDYQKSSQNARKFAIDWLADKKVEDATIKVFEASLDGS